MQVHCPGTAASCFLFRRSGIFNPLWCFYSSLQLWFDSLDTRWALEEAKLSEVALSMAGHTYTYIHTFRIFYCQPYSPNNIYTDIIRYVKCLLRKRWEIFKGHYHRENTFYLWKRDHSIVRQDNFFRILLFNSETISIFKINHRATPNLD